MSNTKKSIPMSFRLEADTATLVEKWCLKNDINSSKLFNLAVKEFISKDHILESVEIVSATDEEVLNATKEMMIKHADALEKLK